jgi:Cu(I)/Ag(I) efflux system periplasmic protein CusF
MRTISRLGAAAAFAFLGVAVIPASASELSDAEVRKVDQEQGKVTLKHGPIKNLDMPGMTMVFNVKDKAMLDKLKPGDKVRFKAAEENGKYTVTEISAAK